MLSEKLSISVLTAQLERGDVNALQTLLETLERFGERQKHENALQRLEQVLGVLILPGELYAQMNETWGLDQLHQASKSDELRRVHLNLCEARNQAIG